MWEQDKLTGMWRNSASGEMRSIEPVEVRDTRSINTASTPSIYGMSNMTTGDGLGSYGWVGDGAGGTIGLNETSYNTLNNTQSGAGDLGFGKGTAPSSGLGINASDVIAGLGVLAGYKSDKAKIALGKAELGQRKDEFAGTLADKRITKDKDGNYVSDYKRASGQIAAGFGR